MAKAKCVNLSGIMAENPNDINLQDADLTDEIFDPDLLLRSFGISDDYCAAAESKDPNILDSIVCDPMTVDGAGMMQQQVGQKQSVIIKNSQMFTPATPLVMTPQHNIFLPQTPAQVTTILPGSGSNTQMTNTFAVTPANTNKQCNISPVTLEQRHNMVSLPVSPLHNILIDTKPGSLADLDPLATVGGNQRKRRQDGSGSGFTEAVFTVPSPVSIAPIYIDQKMIPLNTSDDQVMVFKPIVPVSRPSPQSTPPPIMMEVSDSRTWKYSKSKSGRMTPTGKRSRPHTPTSDSESDGGYRDREPIQRQGSGRNTPVETKPNVRLEDLVDEDKYNKRKRSTSGGDGRKKDPMKMMLEQLQESIPHIGNPSEEKVSHAGLLVEGSDYIRSLKRENNTTMGNVEHMKLKIAQLHAEIEAFQEQLPEHGSSSIHRIVSKRGKSIPDMFADHVRQRTQSDWRYWVYTSIMGHFVHSFAQEVSNISPDEMERTATEWVSEKMSMSQLRKDAFRKLAKLCSKTSIMEDPSKLPDEARGFVAITEPQTQQQYKEFDPI